MKQKDILIILALLFIFVAVWVGTSIYRSVTKSTIPENVSQDIAPISSTFDTKTIDKLKQRRKVNPSFDIENIIPTPTVSPALTVPPEEASEEGQLAL